MTGYRLGRLFPTNVASRTVKNHHLRRKEDIFGSTIANEMRILSPNRSSVSLQMILNYTYGDVGHNYGMMINPLIRSLSETKAEDCFQNIPFVR